MAIWEEFIGPAYKAPSIYQDDQLCVNLYPEIDPIPGAKAKMSLYSTPGSIPMASLGNSVQVRGCWVLPGAAQSIWVAGAGVFLVTIAGTGLASTPVGSLLTSSGQVKMRDNSVQVQICDGAHTYTYTIATQALVVNTAADAIFTCAYPAYIDGFFFNPNIGTAQCYISDVDAVTYTLPFFFTKSGDSDNLVAVLGFDRQAWVIGEKTSELWQNVGGTTLPFQRIDGAFTQFGCAAVYSACNLDNGVAWLAKSERGTAIAVATVNFTPQRVSTHALEEVWQAYSTIADAISLSYQMNGHEFWEITFPTADATWVYDITASQAAGFPVWHQRGWWDSANGVFHRARANCVCSFGGYTLVGDYLNGGVYQLSTSAYIEAGGTQLRRLRRAPHVQDDHLSVFHELLQIEFQPGVGNASAPLPQALMKFSDDGGSTWSSENPATLGAQGNYRNRAYWPTLGESRDRIYEVYVTDAVPVNIINATLVVSSGMN